MGGDEGGKRRGVNLNGYICLLIGEGIQRRTTGLEARPPEDWRIAGQAWEMLTNPRVDAPRGRPLKVNCCEILNINDAWKRRGLSSNGMTVRITLLSQRERLRCTQSKHPDLLMIVFPTFTTSIFDRHPVVRFLVVAK